MTAKKKNRTLPFGLIVALLVTAATLVGLYVGGVVFYGSRYFPNTFVGTIKCGNKKAAYLEEKNHRFAEDYLLTIYDRNNDKYHISGMDIDYQYVAMQNEQQIIERQSPFAWPVEAFKSHMYPLERSFTFDEKLLADRVHTLGLFSEEKILPPENAFLTLTEDGYEITPEIEGTSPIEENILQEIASAIADQSTLVTLSDACYEKPSIRSDDPSIVSTASQIDGFLASTIHYEIDGVDENLSRERILSMLTVSDDGTVTVDEKKVHSFVQHLASTYNTYGDVREFVTSQGDTIRIGGGDYGWVINKPKEAEQILADLAGKVPVSREPVYEQRAMKSGLDDIGNTYVEIDYTNQHMWYYKDSNLVLESDIVSGNIKSGNGSPDGLFKIVYCQRNATLVGEDYESKVSYFMPFAYNVGFHDASWRGSFGNEIYKTNGSHGCINMPTEAAKALIDAIDIGTPVIAYYREPVELTSENARISNAYSYKKPEAN